MVRQGAIRRNQCRGRTEPALVRQGAIRRNQCRGRTEPAQVRQGAIRRNQCRGRTEPAQPLEGLQAVADHPHAHHAEVIAVHVEVGERAVIGERLAHPVEATEVRLDEGGELIVRDVKLGQFGARDEHARHPGHILPADVVLRDVDVLHLQVRVRDEPERGPSIFGQGFVMEVPSGPLASEKSAQIARGDPARVIHVPEEGRNSKQLGAIRGH